MNNMMTVPDSFGILQVAGGVCTFFVANFIAEDYKLFRAGSVLASGLAGELESYCKTLSRLNLLLAAISVRSDTGASPIQRFQGRFATPQDRVYEANVQQVGSLGPDLVADVARAYAEVAAIWSAYGGLHQGLVEVTPVDVQSCLSLSHEIDEWLLDTTALVRELKVRALVNYINRRWMRQL